MFIKKYKILCCKCTLIFALPEIQVGPKNRIRLKRASKLADRAVKLNNTAFVLMMRARTYLLRNFKGEYKNQDQLDSWWGDYADALDDLKNHPGVADFYFQVRAEEAMLDLDQGPSEAIVWMRQAVSKSERFDHRLRLWQYMARSGETKERLAMMREIEEFSKLPLANSLSRRERNKMIDFYARALGDDGPFRKFQLDQVFPGDADGYNLSAHAKFGKLPPAQAFFGDEVDSV